DAASYICPRLIVSDVNDRMKMGASAGLTLRYVGLLGRATGRYPRAALIAACTSRAAPSMLRLKSNCRTMPVEPRELVEVISVTPAMRPNWRSSGAATEVAMVSGLAPGNVAETWIVGKSTVGRAATGRNRKATAPTSATAMVSSVVPTGRRMKGAEMFMPAPAPALLAWTVTLGAHRCVSPIDRTQDTPRVSCRASGSG